MSVTNIESLRDSWCGYGAEPKLMFRPRQPGLLFPKDIDFRENQVTIDPFVYLSRLGRDQSYKIYFLTPKKLLLLKTKIILRCRSVAEIPLLAGCYLCFSLCFKNSLVYVVFPLGTLCNFFLFPTIDNPNPFCKRLLTTYYLLITSLSFQPS